MGTEDLHDLIVIPEYQHDDTSGIDTICLLSTLHLQPTNNGQVGISSPTFNTVRTELKPQTHSNQSSLVSPYRLNDTSLS